MVVLPIKNPEWIGDTPFARVLGHQHWSFGQCLLSVVLGIYRVTQIILLLHASFCYLIRKRFGALGTHCIMPNPWTFYLEPLLVFVHRIS